MPKGIGYGKNAMKGMAGRKKARSKGGKAYGPGGKKKAKGTKKSGGMYKSKRKKK